MRLLHRKSDGVKVAQQADSVTFVLATVLTLNLPCVVANPPVSPVSTEVLRVPRPPSMHCCHFRHPCLVFTPVTAKVFEPTSSTPIYFAPFYCILVECLGNY